MGHLIQSVRFSNNLVGRRCRRHATSDSDNSDVRHRKSHLLNLQVDFICIVHHNEWTNTSCWVRTTLRRIPPILLCTHTCLTPVSGASRNKVLCITQARVITLLESTNVEAHAPTHRHRAPHTNIFPTRPHSRITYSDNHTNTIVICSVLCRNGISLSCRDQTHLITPLRNRCSSNSRMSSFGYHAASRHTSVQQVIQ